MRWAVSRDHPQGLLSCQEPDFPASRHPFSKNRVTLLLREPPRTPGKGNVGEEGWVLMVLLDSSNCHSGQDEPLRSYPAIS